MTHAMRFMATGLVLALCSNATGAEWGTLTGRFVLDGKAPTLKPVEATRYV